MLAITIQRDAWPDTQNFVPSHQAILDAIQRGDPEAARKTVNALLVRAEADALDGLLLRSADTNNTRKPSADDKDARTPVRRDAPARTATGR
jgi:hypothetical protein